MAGLCPPRRFVAVLTDANARLGADVDRYSFIVMDLHHLLLAGLPAHFEFPPQPGSQHFRFSNRPFGVKRFQTIHRTVSMSLASLCFSSEWHQGPSIMGFRRQGGTILTTRPYRQSGHAGSQAEMRSHLIHRPARGHHSTARWSSSVLLSDLVLRGFHAAAAACSRIQRNSVPSTHMRCMITANRRASATIAFFIPRRRAICIAQALSHDHFFECNML